MNKDNLKKLIHALETTKRTFHRGSIWRTNRFTRNARLSIPSADAPVCAIGLCYLDLLGGQKQETVNEQGVYDAVRDFIGLDIDVLWKANDSTLSMTHKETASKLRELLKDEAS